MTAGETEEEAGGPAAAVGPDAGSGKPPGTGHRLQSYASKLERSFVKQLSKTPDPARAQVAEWLEVTKDCVSILQTWAEVEGKYGASLDKIIVSANVLNEVDAGGESGLVAAVAAVVGGFQSLGKHHLGMQQCILTQANTVLTPLVKDHRKQVQEWTSGQTSVQREAKTLRAAVERARESGSSLAVQQASVKYNKQARAQRASLREYLSHLYTLWLHRGETMLICVDAMAEANQHVLSFNEEVATALQTVVAAVDPAAELRKDVAAIVDTAMEGIPETETAAATQATHEDAQQEKTREQAPDTGAASKKKAEDDTNDAAARVYEALGRAEPDVASASVEAATNACANWATISRVAATVSRELAAAVDQRARDTDALASSMNLEHLRVSCEYADLFSEEETKETERQAWRMYMVIMKQSSMVLADFATKLGATADGFAAVTAAYESGSKQLLAARTAAHKELQLVATSLKDARARVEQCDESISRSSQARERALSDVADARKKLRSRSDVSEADLAEASNATEDGTAQSAENAEADVPLSSSAAPDASSPSHPAAGFPAPAAPAAGEDAASTETASHPDEEVMSTASGLSTTQTSSNGATASSNSGGGKSVVKRLFGLSTPSRATVLADAEDRAEKLNKRIASLGDQRVKLQADVDEASQRLEAQIKAYAVQIAGTVSGFVSIHQMRLRDLKAGLEKLVRSASDFTVTIQQLGKKMMQELKKMEPVTDIERFAAMPHAQPDNPTVFGPFHSAKSQPDHESHGKEKDDEDNDDDDNNNNNAHGTNDDDDDDDDDEDGDSASDDGKDEAALDAVPTLNRRNGGFAKRKLKLTESEMLTEEFGLPANEVVVASYSCAYLPGKVPQQGRLILTKQFLCFSTLAIYEPVFGSCKLVVHLAHVVKVIKAATAWGLVANSLVVRLQPRAEGKAQTELTFTSLFNRDKCYGRIVQLSGVNRDLVEKGTKVHSENAPWHELDPRLGESYKGNKLVIGPGDGVTETTASTGSSGTSAGEPTKRPRNSGFLRLGLSTSEVQEMIEAKEKRAEKTSQDGSAALVPTGTAAEADGPFAKPCVQCLRPPGSEPCPCWKVDAPKLSADHKELSKSFWTGSLEEVAARLWLGRERLDLSLPAKYDLAHDLGESLGDYDQEFPAFEHNKDASTAISQFSRELYPSASLLDENDESPSDEALLRIVSFAHPVGNSPWGKQVARSAQVQRLLGLVATDQNQASEEGTKTFRAQPGGRLILNCDTSLSGFPFSDTFMVRTRYVLSEMSNDRKTHPDEAWCRLDVSCRIKWLKAVAVPFLKSKIEKENVATGKRNMAAWIDLARQQQTSNMPTSARVANAQEAVTTAVSSVEEAQGGFLKAFVAGLSAAVDEVSEDLLCTSFYVSAWREASPPQRLQIALLAVLLLVQLLDVLVGLILPR
ncbi:TBC1 domain family member 9B [Hondaea fermentalgiana]|uniref:TBC1 domain family member 9B n=1 Tax=Hondaea fermentalgiana TaxID=2315210 RepID=A0A2R5GYP4_9STRA|nr:TBC1 domain family member 9B [Hondaea fermentalgiana]|eukprot:GBG34938.1 TBC1 domain family member 9B [Hondaea fermentalgiana]